MDKSPTLHIETKVDMDTLYQLAKQGITDGIIKDDTCLTIENFKWEVSSLDKDILLITPVELHI